MLNLEEEIGARFNELVEIELMNRQLWELPSPDHVRIKPIVTGLNYGGRICSDADGTYIYLNVIKEIEGNPSLVERFETTVAAFQSWFEQASPFFNADARALDEEWRTRVNPEELALEFLCSPDLFYNVDLDFYPKLMREHLLAQIDNLVDCSELYSSMCAAVSAVFNFEFPLSQSTLRHEIEHLNPDYRQGIVDTYGEMDSIHVLYKKADAGAFEASPDEFDRSVGKLVEKIVALYPDDEVRAHMWQYFEGLSETEESLTKKRMQLEQALINNYVRGHHGNLVLSALSKQFSYRELFQGRNPPEDTIAHVANIWSSGSPNPEKTPYNRENVNGDMVNSIYRALGQTTLDLTESTILAFDRVEAYFAKQLRKS